jgi:NAD(P)H-dependent FMN reductase
MSKTSIGVMVGSLRRDSFSKKLALCLSGLLEKKSKTASITGNPNAPAFAATAFAAIAFAATAFAAIAFAVLHLPPAIERIPVRV